SRTSFPEALLVHHLMSTQICKDKAILLNTLGSRSLSESTIELVVASLKDEDRNVRSSAVEALGKQSTLSESTTQSLIALLKDEDFMVRFSAVQTLGKQSTLSEPTIQSLIALIKDEDKNVRSLTVLALGKQSTLSESTIQSLIASLKDEDFAAKYHSGSTGVLGLDASVNSQLWWFPKGGLIVDLFLREDGDLDE
ncbi:hypothetical protein FBU30_009975, partial [Linnemannia zychae]